MKGFFGFLAVVLALAFPAPAAYADRGDHNRGYQQQRRGHGNVERHRAPRIERHAERPVVIERHRAPRVVERRIVIERNVHAPRLTHRAPRYGFVGSTPVFVPQYRTPQVVVVERPRYEYWRHNDRYYRIECRGSGLGTIIGVVIGGVIGNAVAGDLGAVLGGLGGAVIGNEVESDRVCR